MPAVPVVVTHLCHRSDECLAVASRGNLKVKLAQYIHSHQGAHYRF